MSDNKLFLTSFPHGELRQVEILGPSKHIRGGVYIRYLDGKRNGGTDTTTEEFLFDIPPSLIQSEL
jgi:hypothetical protein